MKIAVIGASGRLGALICEVIANESTHTLSYMVVSSESKSLGQEKYGVKYTDNITDFTQVDIVVDVSKPESTLKYLQIAANYKKPYIIGTTGFNEAALNKIYEYQSVIPLMMASNFSLGIAVLKKALKLTSSILDKSFDIEITEAHHRNKIDSPSGTAISLFNTIKSVKSDVYMACKERFDIGTRKDNEIGMQSIRGGSIVGEHEVRFISDFEEIYLGHIANNRKIFATGAVKAAEWLISRPSGSIYEFDDIV